MATTCGVLTRPGYRFALELTRTGCFQIRFMLFHVRGELVNCRYLVTDLTVGYHNDRLVAVRQSDDPRRMQTVSLIRI
jgi:hypothetical protein